jgi:hydrogenase maturation protein HypF
MNQATRIEITGIVQGVGMRPLVHRLAQTLNLTGFVANTTSGIIIHIEGPQAAVKAFPKKLTANLPPLAKIISAKVTKIKTAGFTSFNIQESRTDKENPAGLICPDIGICDACLAELRNPRDRRFLYPFINCTNCGPRFSIITGMPYDRRKTTMDAFSMCLDCNTEYNDIHNRRYHAQPNACHSCGPSVTLVEKNRTIASAADAVTMAVARLRKGAIVAIKGIGGFHIACDATNTQSVQKLRTLKRRPSKPFAVMVQSVETAQKYCLVSELEKKLLTAPERPIVLLRKKKTSEITKLLAPDNNYLGVMLCYTPLHYLLFSRTFSAAHPLSMLVMTSGNSSDEPIEIGNESAMKNLEPFCDSFLLNNRAIYNPADDSIVQEINGTAVILRRGRGYAPFPFITGKIYKPTLACGAELKNTVCLADKKNAFVSQYIGDIKTYKTNIFFQETVERMQNIFSIKPALIACDKHPDYLSTRFAHEYHNRHRRSKLIEVQHHHAHMASVIAEHGIKGSCIGVCFDGTGLGDDGCVWGGEFLVGNTRAVKRCAFLEYVPMPGGEKAVKEPIRMAASHLYNAFGEDMYRLAIGFTNTYHQKLADFVTAGKMQTIRTSSVGRLFDAIAAILGICDIVTYEAQAAIRLQMFAERSSTKTAYPFTISRRNKMLVIDPQDLMQKLVEDLKEQTTREDIARKFHNGVAAMIRKTCDEIRKKYSTGTVCLCGGVFQNKLLLELAVSALKESKFKVYHNELLPANDASISMGQAAVVNS